MAGRIGAVPERTLTIKQLRRLARSFGEISDLEMDGALHGRGVS